MTSRTLATRYDFALGLVREAGTLALDYFKTRDSLTVSAKGPQDLVSEADVNTERLIRSRIAEAFPGDAFLGEESGATAFKPGQGVWVVDPIDGTQPFLNGLSAWCVSIAYVEAGAAQLGTVYAPVRKELFAGGAGWPATLNDRPVGRHPGQSLKDGLVELGYSTRTDLTSFTSLLAEFLARGGMFSRGGSGALALAYVAAGRLAGYLEAHMNAWDCLGAIAILHAAGLKANDFLAGDGMRKGGPVIAGNAAVYAELSALARKHGVMVVD